MGYSDAIKQRARDLRAKCGLTYAQIADVLRENGRRPSEKSVQRWLTNRTTWAAPRAAEPNAKSEEPVKQLAAQAGDVSSTILEPEQVLEKVGKSEEMPEKTESTTSVRDRLDQFMARYRLWYEQQENQRGKSLPPGAVSERVDARAGPPTLKEQLLALLYEGRRLAKQCLDGGSPLPIAPAEHWRKKTYALLERQIAKYIADIYDEPGFAPLTDSFVRKNGPSSAEHRELWMPIAARVIRLENILRMFENLD